MKSTPSARSKASSERLAYLAVDVSGDSLDLYATLADDLVQYRFANRTDVVERELVRMRDQALAKGYTAVAVACEPSGGCEKVLLETAARLGLRTTWVNGESVAKLRMVESNDSGKTDIKDPRVIHLLTTLGKTLKHRRHEAPYSLLQEEHAIYLHAEAAVTVAKEAIHKQLRCIFPDFTFKSDFLFGPSGLALLKLFGLDPQRILAVEPRVFEQRVRKLAPRIQKKSLARIRADAAISALNPVDPRLRAVQVRRLMHLFEEFEFHTGCKLKAARAMEQLYAEAQKHDRKLPDASRGVITTFHLARILAVTGPLLDFTTTRQLLRYLGLNLRERQSGKYKGHTKISKKGSAVGRHVLSQVVLPLVKQNRLFGDRYHAKCAAGMPGTKAMTVMVRAFVKMFFGWYRSGVQFDRNRVFVAQSEYKQAA